MTTKVKTKKKRSAKASAIRKPVFFTEEQKRNRIWTDYNGREWGALADLFEEVAHPDNMEVIKEDPTKFLGQIWANLDSFETWVRKTQGAKIEKLIVKHINSQPTRVIPKNDYLRIVEQFGAYYYIVKADCFVFPRKGKGGKTINLKNRRKQLRTSDPAAEFRLIVQCPLYCEPLLRTLQREFRDIYIESHKENANDPETFYFSEEALEKYVKRIQHFYKDFITSAKNSIPSYVHRGSNSSEIPDNATSSESDNSELETPHDTFEESGESKLFSSLDPHRLEELKKQFPNINESELNHLITFEDKLIPLQNHPTFHHLISNYIVDPSTPSITLKSVIKSRKKFYEDHNLIYRRASSTAKIINACLGINVENYQYKNLKPQVFPS